ncbi:MAG: hypothetical protein FGM41_07065 [Bacteroidetes bacterium]|jgi:hypothetical protein|nr:hypothetical protein [Bacteroidota bacterium]
MGRQISLELFLFSYLVYLQWVDEEASPESAAGYMRIVGFPKCFLNQGLIFTQNKEDTFKVENGTVEAIPFYSWASAHNKR